jgi:hypothetical protein
VSTRRTSVRRPRRGRALLTGGVAVVLALIPGTALAEGQDPAPDPLGQVTTTVEDTAGAVAGAEDESADAGGLPLPGQEDAAAEEQPATGEAAEAPAFEGFTPEELQVLLDELAAAGIPVDCAEDLAAGVEEILLGLQESLDPAQFEQLLTELEASLATLQEGGEPELPPTLADPELVAQLEALGASLEECLAAGPPTEEPPAPTEPPAAPVHEPPAAPAAAPQSVSYPGYAPTGAEAPEETPGSASLAALGAGLLAVGGAGVVGSRMRTRAARDEG